MPLSSTAARRQQSGDRGFKETIVTETGCQKLSTERVCRREGRRSSFSKQLSWRNNLTGLSHATNLYFAAYNDAVWIFEPTSYSQALDPKPSLVLSHSPSLRAGVGQLSPGSPHDINHLLIGPLGHEEILVCACDDGDVYAYTIRSIQSFLISSRNRTKPQPFFIQNVRSSAWGLAIHQTARYIAVSSNSHNIDVFALPIAGSGQSDRSSEGHHYTLTGHEANIPSLAFVRSEGDSIHLASTDIKGVLFVWEVGSQAPMKSKVVYRSNVDTLGSAHSQGWGVLCLDTSSFRLCYTSLQTWGCLPGEQANEINITKPMQSIKSHSKLITCERIDSNPPESSGSFVESNDTIFHYWDEMEGDNIPARTRKRPRTGSFSMALRDLRRQQNVLGSTRNLDLSRSSDFEIFERILRWHPSCLTVPKKQVPAFVQRTTISSSLSWAILHTTARDVALYAKPDKIEGNRPDLLHSVKLQSPLLDRGVQGFGHMFQRARNNLLVSIPELGIVVVGSGIGRACLLSLTRNAFTGDLGFRLDVCLPFRWQELLNKTAEVFLVGVAASPTGRRKGALRLGNAEDLPSAQRCGVELNCRWRLMLTYSNGIILSYEIRRPPDRPAGEDIGMEDFLENL